MKKILKNLLVYPGSSRRASSAPQDDGRLGGFISKHQNADRKDDKSEHPSLRLSSLPSSRDPGQPAQHWGLTAVPSGKILFVALDPCSRAWATVERRARTHPPTSQSSPEKTPNAQKTRSSNTQDGFILLEVVIALFIMGLTVQGGLMFMTHMNQHKKRMETETKQAMVLRTLAAHALIQGRLPWAADPKAPPTTFGYEDKAHSRQQGIVPFKTLGIAEHYAKDGYGHYFTYLVAKTRPAPLTVSPTENYCRAQAEAPLIHKDYSMRPREVAGGDARIDPGVNTGSDFIAVALISHTSKNEDHESYALPNLPESTPDRTVTWVTRDTLLTLYGQASCAPFHQPLPGPIIDAPIIPRGYGR